jgi:hypothetical protein
VPESMQGPILSILPPAGRLPWGQHSIFRFCSAHPLGALTSDPSVHKPNAHLSTNSSSDYVSRALTEYPYLLSREFGVCRGGGTGKVPRCWI